MRAPSTLPAMKQRETESFNSTGTKTEHLRPPVRSLQEDSGRAGALGNQGGLVLAGDGEWLLAVNAGSNDISVFVVDSEAGTLRLTAVWRSASY